MVKPLPGESTVEKYKEPISKKLRKIRQRKELIISNLKELNKLHLKELEELKALMENEGSTNIS